jgi:hypothetical protein
LLVGKDSHTDALLRHFGSLKALSRASFKQLRQFLRKAKAKAIVAAFSMSKVADVEHALSAPQVLGGNQWKIVDVLPAFLGICYQPPQKKSDSSNGKLFTNKMLRLQSWRRGESNCSSLPRAADKAADKELRGDHDLVADGCQRPADQPLVLTGGVALRGVVKGAAQVERLAHQVDRLVVAHPRPVSVAEPHAAESDRRDFQIALSECALLHTQAAPARLPCLLPLTVSRIKSSNGHSLRLKCSATASFTIYVATAHADWDIFFGKRSCDLRTGFEGPTGG